MKPKDKKRLKRFWLRKGLLLTGAIGGMALVTTRVPILLDKFSHELYTNSAVGIGPVAREFLGEELGTGIKESADEVTTFLLEMENKMAFPFLLKVLTSQCCISEFLLLYGLMVGALAALISSFRLRNPYPLSWSGHLLLPEEMMAELIALKCRRQKQNIPQWKLQLELTTEVLLLLCAIHIQVRLQNLSLPPSKKQNID
jgi:hypothetical protein